MSGLIETADERAAWKWAASGMRLPYGGATMDLVWRQPVMNGPTTRKTLL